MSKVDAPNISNSSHINEENSDNLNQNENGTNSKELKKEKEKEKEVVTKIGEYVDKSKIQLHESINQRKDPSKHQLCIWLHAYKYSRFLIFYYFFLHLRFFYLNNIFINLVILGNIKQKCRTGQRKILMILN